MRELFVARVCRGDNSSFSDLSLKIRIRRRVRRATGRKNILIELISA
jgi:hypothetical protein